VLKNSSKGNLLEQKLSVEFHQNSIPLLISPLLLRSRGLGQVDLARFKKNTEMIIELCEVKSSKTGEFAMRGQHLRLRKTGVFLGIIFGLKIKFIIKVG